ncbi:MAG: MATE family efflux transporter, partial [Ignisphaera sp.]
MNRASDSLINVYRDKILHGPIYRVLIWLGLPVVLVQLVNISYNIADAFWLSQYSTVTLAVPRQVWPTFMVFQALAIALGAANQSLISQYIGAKMYNETARVIKQYITVSTSFGIIFGTSYYLLRPFVPGYLFLFVYVLLYPGTSTSPIQIPISVWVRGWLLSPMARGSHLAQALDGLEHHSHHHPGLPINIEQ